MSNENSRASALEQTETFDVMAQGNEVAEAEAAGEWKNGDECIHNGESFKFVSKMPEPESDHVVIWRSLDGVKVVYHTEISKPKTEREAFIEEALSLMESVNSESISSLDAIELMFDSGKFKLVEGE